MLNQTPSIERETHPSVWESSMKILAACGKDPGKWLELPETNRAARYIWNNLPGHHCYWNDRFAISLICKLSKDELEQAMIRSVQNGLFRYWEWETHYGFNLWKLLRSWRVQDLPSTKPILEKGHIYTSLNHKTAKSICDAFGLPENKRYLIVR